MLLSQIDVDTIMPPRIRTRSVGRPAAESLGGGTGKQVGRGGRARRPREANDERVEMILMENVGNVMVNENRVGCSYKEFLACNPKEYDEVSLSHEMQKLESELWNHVMVGAGHAAYTDRFHELARLVPFVAATEPKTMQKAVQISSALTDEAVRNGSIKKVEKRVNVGEPSKDRKLFSDYDCEICYHPGKTNVVAAALSRKERVKPKRFRAMNMIFQSSTKYRILATQKEAVDEFAVL
ncbi:hypothetical protein Tco_0241204 [Tanacetum coccineum]